MGSGLYRCSSKDGWYFLYSKSCNRCTDGYRDCYGVFFYKHEYIYEQDHTRPNLLIPAILLTFNDGE
jgi:hypothetical protein